MKIEMTIMEEEYLVATKKTEPPVVELRIEPPVVELRIEPPVVELKMMA